MGKTMARILSTALLVPILVFAVAASSWAAWRCQYDGVARSACCCPHADDAGDASPAFQTGDCCEIERVDVEKAPSEPSRGQPTMTEPQLAVPMGVIAFDEQPSPARALLRPSDDRPPGGRVLILQKQSLLI